VDQHPQFRRFGPAFRRLQVIELGREMGYEAIELYTEVKAVAVAL
jgi:hypothetical protein